MSKTALRASILYSSTCTSEKKKKILPKTFNNQKQKVRASKTTQLYQIVPLLFHFPHFTSASSKTLTGLQTIYKKGKIKIEEKEEAKKRIGFSISRIDHLDLIST